MTNACFCGNEIGASGILCTRCEALRVLELDSQATQQQIKAAYRILVKVWHPDRFTGDEVLKVSAEQKLRNVNLAYRILAGTSENPERGSKRVRAKAASQGVTAGTNSNSTTGLTPDEEISTTVAMRLRWTLGLLFKICLLLFAILIGRYFWIAFDLPELSGGAMQRVYDAGLDSVSVELQGPEHRFLSTLGADLKKLGLDGPAAAVAAAEKSEDASAQNAESPQTEPVLNDKPPKKQSSKTPRIVHSYITIGSTRDEVIAQHGPPTSSSEDKLVYGRSELDLKNGAVVGWRINPESNPIRVKMWPEHSVDTSQTFFTVDSTKDDVLVVQGTPTAFSQDKFEYGGSEVYFRNNRVVRWKNDLSTVPLRVKNP